MKRQPFLAFLIGLLATIIFSLSVFAQAESSALLYKINGKDLSKPSYLYGTIHLICPTDMFSMDKINPYFNQTERLILELDLDDPTVMDKALTALNMPEGKTLRDYLSPEKYAKVDQMFKNIMGISVEMFKTMNPTGLSVIIGTSPKSTGCLIPSSYETTFAEMAAQNKMSVEGLETVEDQLAALNQIPLEKQAEDLYQLTLEPQKPITQFKELLAIYKLQDSEKLAEFIAKETAKSPEFQKALLDERNKKWIPKIEKAIAEKPSFIAVGSGHLGGKNGVVNLLKKKGYIVTPIRF